MAKQKPWRKLRIPKGKGNYTNEELKAAVEAAIHARETGKYIPTKKGLFNIAGIK